ncbi:MAG: acyl-CoA dehydrogenase family protein [Myxococcales bacterium]|nr:acyl-CoA dehydrogenase family protein [Myxococcales bacterium]
MTATARAAEASSSARRWPIEADQAAIDSALQLHGGRAVRVDSFLARLSQQVRAPRIHGGSGDADRLRIARALLAEPGSR